MGQEAEERAAQSTESEAAAAQNAGPAGSQNTQNAEPQGDPGGNGQNTSRPANEPLRISSPEQVDDYIRVTTPGMWLLSVAILILLAAGIIWAYASKVEMNTVKADGTVATEYVSPASFLTDGNIGS